MMNATAPKHHSYSSPAADFLPGEWSVHVDDHAVHEHLDERRAWAQFKSHGVHFEHSGKTVFLKKKDKVMMTQRVK